MNPIERFVTWIRKAHEEPIDVAYWTSDNEYVLLSPEHAWDIAEKRKRHAETFCSVAVILTLTSVCVLAAVLRK